MKYDQTKQTKPAKYFFHLTPDLVNIEQLPLYDTLESW